MNDILNQFSHNDHFFFSPDEDLGQVCNAPKDKAGVYVIYKLFKGKVILVYIGSSGKILNNGTLKIRKGGLYDRLVNGKQFDEPRKKSWKKTMQAEGIDALDVYWYAIDENKEDEFFIPSFIELMLLQDYVDIYNELPEWNVQV